MEHHAQIFFSQNQYWIKDLTGKGLSPDQSPPRQPAIPLDSSTMIFPLGPKAYFRFIGEGRLVEVSDPIRRTLLPSPSKKKGFRKRTGS